MLRVVRPVVLVACVALVTGFCCWSVLFPHTVRVKHHITRETGLFYVRTCVGSRASRWCGWHYIWEPEALECQVAHSAVTYLINRDGALPPGNLTTALQDEFGFTVFSEGPPAIYFADQHLKLDQVATALLLAASDISNVVILAVVWFQAWLWLDTAGRYTRAALWLAGACVCVIPIITTVLCAHTTYNKWRPAAYGQAVFTGLLAGCHVLSMCITARSPVKTDEPTFD